MVTFVEKGENWRCPYCGRDQVVLSERRDRQIKGIANDMSEWGPLGFTADTIVCANNACRKMTLWFTLRRRAGNPWSEFKLHETVQSWQLLPESPAKPQPEFIPVPVRDAYFKACRIRDLSPEASATLSRRCLQGMIRDFCGISKKRLIDEIDALRAQVGAGKAPTGVQPDTMDAIDAVRRIGNIGAHMEKDIDVIVDVDEGEAQALIDLIELLFDEWYVARKVRGEKISRLGVVAAQKAQARRGTPQEEIVAPRSSPLETPETSDDRGPG